MGGEQERRWDDAVDGAWREFRQRLADHVAAMGEDAVAVVWFRRDLRLDDNPAWAAATAEAGAVVALYVLDRRLLDAAGPHRRRRVLHDLAALDRSLREVGGSLCVRTGDAVEVVPAVAAEAGATVVHANADGTPYATARDDATAAALVGAGVEVRWSWGTLVHRPGAVCTTSGTLSKVFTPFHRAWAATPWDPWPEPGDARLLDHPGERLPEPDGPYPLIGGEEGRARRAHLQTLIVQLQDELKLQRWQLLPSPTAIQPVVIGANDEAMQASAALNAQGIWVTAIRPPTVPVGTARLRIALSASHTADEVRHLTSALHALERGK